LKPIVAAGWCLVMIGVLGCHEQPAPQRYPENLGDASQPLLPTPPGQYDPAIVNGRANVVELGEQAAEQARPDEDVGEQGSSLPANHWGRFVQNLLGGGSGRTGRPTAPPDRGGRGPGAPPAAEVALSAEDEAAIREVYAAYDKAGSELRFDDVAQYLVQDQRDPWETVAPQTRKFIDALTDIRDEFGETAPQTVAAAQTLLAQILATRELESVQMVNSDRAVGHRGSMPIGFERSGDRWYVRAPDVPSAERADEMANIVRDAAGKFEEIIDGLDEETLDDAAALGRLQQAAQELAGGMMPILMESASAISG
jgi:hypothetical protein